MRNVPVIFLLGLLLLIETPAGQFLRLPLLIEHFAKHQKQDGHSLLLFLDEHYSASHNDADLPEDEQLPFKTITLNGIGYAIVPEAAQPDLLVHSTVNEIVFSLDAYTPQQHLASIFHPPRQ